MDDSYLSHLLRMTIASAICTAMIGFGLFARRGDRSRRWLFVAAGILCSAITGVTLVVTESAYGVYRDGYSPIVELVIAGALLLAATGLILLGWKGRQIGDHPYCRECGFDLFGKPPASTRCSECGTDLMSVKSVVLGLWRVRRGAVLSGLFMLILGLMLGGEAGREYTTGFDWQRWLPTWWLLRDFDSPDSHAWAVQALGDEMMSADLSHPHAQLIAERVLGDLEAGRTNELSDYLFVLVDRRDLLDEATTRRVMRQMMSLGFIIPPVIERGRPFILYDWFAAGQPSGNSNGVYGFLNLRWKLVRLSYRIGGFSVPASEIKPTSVGRGPNAAVNQPWVDLGGDWSKVPSGNVIVLRDVVLTVMLHYRGRLLVETTQTTLQQFTRVVEPGNTSP